MASTEFTYFDQFQDVTIDLSPYFDAINADQPYQYSFTTTQPIKTTLKNLFTQVDLINDFKSKISFFTSYAIQEKESPESVSYKFYKTMNNWWIIALFNNMNNMINDWPMSEDQLQILADRLFVKEGKYSRAAYYALLSERNEIKRNILVLQPVYINDVITTFRKEIELVTG